MRLSILIVAFFGFAATAAAITPTSQVHHPSLAIGVSSEMAAVSRANRIVAPASLYAALAKFTKKVPAFSRQTKLACSTCHYQFPQLTPFGRLFKLNGYTLTGIPTIGEPGDSAGHESLNLLSIPPVAAMAVVSATQLNKSQPGTQNGTIGFPQQFSLFVAGQIAPNFGAFTQFTYESSGGSFGVDNIDIRYANHTMVADRDLIYGVTLHNNPTVQDVWNTVPAWGYPFMSSGSAPSQMASPLIDGGLGQQVAGLGAYSMYNSTLYTEVTAYRSAQQATTAPLDSSASMVTSGVIPYWRIALQHETPTTSLMVGTYGFAARVFPTGVTGTTNHYTDIAVDAQVEHRSGPATWIGRGTYIRENQKLDGTFGAGEATSASQRLSTARVNLAYLPNLKYSFTLGYSATSGTSDKLLYVPSPVTGSNSGSPNTSGLIGEFNYNAWQNTRLGLQYSMYSRFNGGSSAYDVAGGRRATDNNTLFGYLWFAF